MTTKTDADLVLPRDLGDGLVLRWSSAADADALAEFNVRIHSDDPGEPEEFLGHWTRDLLSGRHPTSKPEDFSIVVDEAAGGEVVSCTCLISQTWSYDGVLFGCGRLELVATHPDYRRRGLIRAQFEALHAKSARRGELVQAITGIPWYYRQFGYEMALDLGGYRLYFWERPGNLAEVDEEPYRMRPATPDDIPLLVRLYDVHCRAGMVWRVRDEAQWHWELAGTHRESAYYRDFRVIETADREAVAYVEVSAWAPTAVTWPSFAVREFAVLPGHPWRPVLAFLARALKAESDAREEAGERPMPKVSFNLGAVHPAYDALSRQLERQMPVYAWYLRVADLPAFLRHIAPVLEQRLAGSVMAGHTGTLRLNFYDRQMTLDFAEGNLADVGTFEPEGIADGDALFPDLTFLQLVFGYRSLEELTSARADCYDRKVEAGVLLDALFPKRHSQPIGLG